MITNVLQESARVLTEDLLKTKPGEIFVITADTRSDMDVAHAIEISAGMAGAKTIVLLTPTPGGVSLEADKDIPVEPLSALLSQADIWVELNKQWLLYSTPFYRAKKANLKLRHVCLTGTTADTLISCVGKINYPVMRDFTAKLTEKIRNARHVRFVSPHGEEISFMNAPERPISVKMGYMDKPGTHLFMGQMGWTPDIESVNGTICLDGSVAPDIGLVKSPIYLELKDGIICSIYGGSQAKQYEEWLKSFNHPQMLRVSHAGLGFHPSARVQGDILQDQRAWGSTTWGFGSIGAAMLPPDGVFAPSHSDAVSLNTSIYLDDAPLWINSIMVDPDLAGLAKDLVLK